MNREIIIICANDYPHCALSDDAAEQDAKRICKKLQEEDSRNKNDRDITTVYYHWHSVKTMEIS